MEIQMQTEEKKPRGWIRSAVFALAGAFFLYEYLHLGERAHLISAIGFALILPNTFLNPVNWRRPGETGRNKKVNPALTVVSLIGTVMIISGLVMAWR